jgi:hypothetical protein
MTYPFQLFYVLYNSTSFIVLSSTLLGILILLVSQLFYAKKYSAAESLWLMHIVFCIHLLILDISVCNSNSRSGWLTRELAQKIK